MYQNVFTGLGKYTIDILKAWEVVLAEVYSACKLISPVEYAPANYNISWVYEVLSCTLKNSLEIKKSLMNLIFWRGRLNSMGILMPLISSEKSKIYLYLQ